MNKITFVVSVAIQILGVTSLAANSIIELEKQVLTLSENQIELNLEKMRIEQQILEIKKQITDRKSLISKRMKLYYYLQRNGWGNLLFDGNVSKTDRNIYLLKNLSAFDISLLRNYKNNLQALTNAERNLNETSNTLASNLLLIRQQEAALSTEQESYLRIAKQNNQSTFLKLKNQLARPLDRNPDSLYGSVLDKNNQFFLVNNGHVYRNTSKEKIRSVGLGRIIFRDQMPRWRETLIVEHDDHYFSVYAGVLSSTKKVGDLVEKAEFLGLASDEFYFELRHFSTPINPENWFAKE